MAELFECYIKYHQTNCYAHMKKHEVYANKILVQKCSFVPHILREELPIEVISRGIVKSKRHLKAHQHLY